MKKYHHTKLLTMSALTALISMASPAFAESMGQYIDDATITAKVKEAIFANKQLKILQIEVGTDHGAVTLSGAVDSKDDENEAMRVTKLINGVISVYDDLSIKVADASDMTD